MGALTDPIIAWPSGWMDTIPDWMKEAVPLERLIQAHQKEELASDLEAAIYMYPRTMEAGLDHDWAQIYFYVTSRAIAKWRKTEVPEDIRVEKLTTGQERDLQHLKSWLYERRIRARQEKGRAERRTLREQQEAEREELRRRQLVMF